MPLSIACCGERIRTFLPLSQISPLSAPPKLEAHIGKNSSTGEMADFQHHFPDLCLTLGEKIGEFTPDHVLDDLFGSHLADRGGNDMCAITEDSQAISNLENFFQAVAHKEYSHAALAQLLHDGK